MASSYCSCGALINLCVVSSGLDILSSTTMSLPIKLVSTDFDGTLFASLKIPPIPPRLSRSSAICRQRRVKWSSTPGADGSLMETLGRADSGAAGLSGLGGAGDLPARRRALCAGRAVEYGVSSGSRTAFCAGATGGGALMDWVNKAVQGDGLRGCVVTVLFDRRKQRRCRCNPCARLTSFANASGNDCGAQRCLRAV